MPDSNNKQVLSQPLDWQDAHLRTPPKLSEGEVHLWYINLDLNEEQKEVTLALLSERQKDRYQRRYNQELKDSYLAGRYYLRTLLASYSNLPEKDIAFQYSRLNKPALLKNPKEIEFNFTDTFCSGRAVGLFAIGKNRQLGVDIEAVSRTAQFKAIAEKRFCESELAYASNSNGDVDHQKFLEIWTRKEAYGKATGKGINFRMREIDLLKDGGATLKFTDQDNSQYYLQQFNIDEKMIACVVSEGHQNVEISALNLENQIP